MKAPANTPEPALAIAAQLHARAVELCEGTGVSVDMALTLATVASRMADNGGWSTINALLIGRQN